jgi:gliding motility-associated-like protein
MKFLLKTLLIYFILITNLGYGQYCPYLGPDQLLPCGIGSTTLTADLSQCGAGLNPNQTTNYGVTNVPYSPDSYTNGTQVILGDDAISGSIPIGFNFCFFGQTYNTFYIASNNWVGFSAGQNSTWVTTPIPNGTGSAPMNCIMGPWQDINPGLGGTIKYAVYGTAPCRRLVISYYQVPMFSCTNQLYSSQIKIYETTNVIETHILNKPICGTWNSGNAVHGVHNSTGTQAILVQPPVSTSIRNNNQWSTQNEGVRFTPSGPVVTPTLTWYQVGNPNPIGTGPTITVTPPPQGANYTCRFVYPSCNAGWATCNANGGLGPDTVFVQPGPPNLPQPIINFTNPTCNTYCDGTIDIIPQGGNGIQTISWNGSQPPQFNQSGLCSGPYSFTIIDAAGCTVSSIVNLIDPPSLTIDPIIGSDTICFNSSTNSFNISSITPNLNYVWSVTNGIITSGQGNNQINLDVNGVLGGLYPNMVSVYGQNVNGCVSQTENFSVEVLNILPIISPMGPYCEYDNCVNLNATPSGGLFLGNNVWGNQYCPDNGYIGSDNVTYSYYQSGCMFNTNINVIVNPRPILNDINPSNSYFELCEGDSIGVIYSTSSTLSGIYEWIVMGDTFEVDNLYYSWDEFGIFTINVTQTANGCQSLPQQTTITLDECPQELIFIPNTFTPNGDEFNTLWGPIFTSGYDDYGFELLVFNRWGNIIWESKDPAGKWDGTFNNKLCPDGIYTWKIVFSVKNTDEKKEIHGFITLIR